MKFTPEHKKDYFEYYATRPQQVVPLPHHQQILRVAADCHAKTVLDYGSGPAKALEHFARDLNVTSYDLYLDRGRNDTDHFRQPFDMVVCHHVLEHVEPECLDSVLRDIKRLTNKCAYIVVSLQESTKTLPSGKPWHTIVHDEQWWKQRLAAHFEKFAELPVRNKNEYAILWVK